MIMTPPVLQMRGVRRSFPAAREPVQVLRGVDLDVYAGDFAALTGPSGSGKTTLLNLAALMDTPCSGEIRFAGQTVSDMDERRLCETRKRKIGIVFQRFCLLSNRSALDNVLFRFRYLDIDRREALLLAEEALELVGVHYLADRLARVLSVGEMQRVAIARAVAIKPALLVADEPTGNLDTLNTQSVMDCFRRLNQVGLTILMVTHNPDLLQYASRHLVCRAGRVEETPSR